MTVYDGQSEGQVGLLKSEAEAGLTPELLFSERDRRRAHAELQADIPLMNFDLYERLHKMAEFGSHQAQWYIEQLHEKARLHGKTALSNIED